MKTSVFAALAVACLGTGCSAVLDWDPDGLACLDQQCRSGFTCLGTTCVRDGTLARGETCNDDLQCSKNPVELVCPDSVFVCSQACSNDDFYSQGTCRSGEYCRPVFDTEQWTGACVASDGCSSDEDCLGANEVCVRITSQASACLIGCTVTFPSGAYSDTCGSTQSAQRVCQPVGLSSAQRLVCIDITEPTPQAENNPCTNVVTSACAPGLACIEGKCRKHCDPAGANQCGTSNTCCTRQLEQNASPNAYSVCGDAGTPPVCPS